MPEARIGLFPMIIVAHLARALPRKVLLEMMLTGTAIDAEEAHRIAFVSHVYPDREAMLARPRSTAARSRKSAPRRSVSDGRPSACWSTCPRNRRLTRPSSLTFRSSSARICVKERRLSSRNDRPTGGGREAVPMSEAFIVGAVRTPVGRRGGALSGAHPADLGAHVLRAIVDRTGIDPAAVDDVIFGCVSQVGPQAFNIARTAALSAGLLRSRCLARRSTGSAVRLSRPFISPPRRSAAATWTW